MANLEYGTHYLVGKKEDLEKYDAWLEDVFNKANATFDDADFVLVADAIGEAGEKCCCRGRFIGRYAHYEQPADDAEIQLDDGEEYLAYSSEESWEIHSDIFVALKNYLNLPLQYGYTWFGNAEGDSYASSPKFTKGKKIFVDLCIDNVPEGTEKFVEDYNGTYGLMTLDELMKMFADAGITEKDPDKAREDFCEKYEGDGDNYLNISPVLYDEGTPEEVIAHNRAMLGFVSAFLDFVDPQEDSNQ